MGWLDWMGRVWWVGRGARPTSWRTSQDGLSGWGGLGGWVGERGNGWDGVGETVCWLVWLDRWLRWVVGWVGWIWIDRWLRWVLGWLCGWLVGWVGG